LLCGDSTDSGDLGRLLGNTRANLTFTDPPYNVAYGSRGGARATDRKRTIQNDDLGEDFYDFLRTACENLLSVTDGAVYICMSSSELHTLQRAFVEAGGHWSTFIIWAKRSFTLGRSDYQRQYEPILYGWREGSKHHWCGDRDQGDVWNFDKPAASPLHPTTKPVELAQRAIENRNREPGAKLIAKYLKLERHAEVVAGEAGKVLYRLPNGKEYKSTSALGTAITGKSGP